MKPTAMSADNNGLEKYKKFLLNRVTSTAVIADYIENSLTSEDESSKHYFHKIMIHNWQDTLPELFDRLSVYFGTMIIPVNCTMQGDIATFYTSNLTFILKIIKFDFMFPHCRNMYSLDVLFNDRSSVDFFGSMTTIDEIVTGVVSKRFNEKCELDLSNFCDDPEFISNKICFYKISLLAHFKILMLRMGRDTKTLNLSNNHLSQVPLDVLNFFIKADLTAVNFSNNNIPSISELLRVSSKIEKLWLEGNPLCEDLDPVTYVKNVTIKFPRLTELDGIKLNQHGSFPFFRHYLATPDRKTKMLVEKFVTLYFSNYDQPPRIRKRKIELYYDEKALLTISSDFWDSEKALFPYIQLSRNIMNPSRKQHVAKGARTFSSRQGISSILSTLPETIHDRSTFSVDVLAHDKKFLHLIVDGVFKDKHSNLCFQFRRTFIFSIYTVKDNSVYHITNEMFSLTHATAEQINNSFQHPIRNMNSLVLINPSPEESEAVVTAFQQLTQLKKSEAELRLKFHDWDIREALKTFMIDARHKKMSSELFIDSDVSSDSSSILDEIDY